ncbi:DNA-binding transcriptional regulator, GntR family [Atopostipes suicloacalis DSM 15692]|uniref:DNA-binding transcriptional regulator, GntR family n=1 Tax=Atopostipes suicloacalis DSM 15692 TaxID=1121025 RepID=A0A1M4U635_9LACT|nr:GntR family transcriptional regulator [Atopostipes suicloacalis]SHE52104.1 DNA-binding transcriptional regulator, GntR family [Atopostipes suicloacalis DSM 15692]
MVKKKLDQIVYEQIVRQIKNGQLLPREHITEQWVADELQISRTPVRKAFSRLEEDNYLEMIQNIGVRVKIQNLDSKSFQDQVNFIERLLNQYLFDIEKKEQIFDARPLQNHLAAMHEQMDKENSVFEEMELDYWCDLLKYSENAYMKDSIMKTIQTILFDEGFIDQIMKKSRTLKSKHLECLIDYLTENNYIKARREIRILMNQLKLNVIEENYKYN